jgi:hypothetical protein
VTAALTRRTRWLLVAGAVGLALLVNVAWVTLGPEGASAPSRGQELESILRRTWEQHGQAVRSVSCSEASGSWSCRLRPERGREVVTCSLGTAPPQLVVDPAQLAEVCRSGR